MAQRLVVGRIAMLAVCFVAAPILVAAPQRSPCVPPPGTTPVEFRSGDNILRGFIDLPAGAGRHPAIMIIHGGADTDVTADVEYWKQMRSAFRRAGIATLVWDKAGNGCSSGSYSSKLTIQERATEALAALEILKRREDIDSARIGLWALSQGGWVAPMVAVRSASIAYLIVVSGPGRDALSQGLYPAIHVLREAGVSGPEADDAYAALRKSLAVLRAGGTAQESAAVVAPLRKYPALQKAYGLDLATVESLRVLLAQQPAWSIEAAVFLEQLDQPTLAIFGERDAMVDWRESIAVYRSSFARSGNRDLTIKTFPDADHEMVPTAARRRAGEMFVEGYLETMIEWLAARNFTGKSG